MGCESVKLLTLWKSILIFQTLCFLSKQKWNFVYLQTSYGSVNIEIFE